MNTPNLIVRAGEVGYGHIKFTVVRDTENGALRTDSIPSQSPAHKGTIVAGGGGVMKRRDTFIVPVENRLYEVGREVHRALTGKQETEVLDEKFALSASCIDKVLIIQGFFFLYVAVIQTGLQK